MSLREIVDGAHVLGMNENTARDWYFSLPKNEDHEVDMEMIIEKFLERPAGLEKSAYGLDHRGYTRVYTVETIICVHVRVDVCALVCRVQYHKILAASTRFLLLFLKICFANACSVLILSLSSSYLHLHLLLLLLHFLLP